MNSGNCSLTLPQGRMEKWAEAAEGEAVANVGWSGRSDKQAR